MSVAAGWLSWWDTKRPVDVVLSIQTHSNQRNASFLLPTLNHQPSTSNLYSGAPNVWTKINRPRASGTSTTPVSV
jgi:hypothetical protein